MADDRSNVLQGVESGVQESGFQLPLIYHNQPLLHIPGPSSTLLQIIVKTSTLPLEPDSCYRSTPAIHRTRTTTNGPHR